MSTTSNNKSCFKLTGVFSGLFSGVLIALLMVLPLSQAFAEVIGRVDRNIAYEGQSITFSIKADNLAGMKKPDFSPLQNLFDMSGTSQSSSISIINGRSTASQTWSVRLTPKKSGKQTIPAISVGQYETQPIEIEIRPIPEQTSTEFTGQPLFLSLEVDSKAKSFYVQQPIPLLLRLYYKHNVTNGRIADPTADNLSLERLGEDNNYTTEHNGQPYRVFERRYSLIPEKSGLLTIPSATFNGQMRSPQRSNNSQRAYDPFSQFIFRPQADQGQPVSIKSKPLTIEIKSHPSAFDGTQWLPAESLELTDSWTSQLPDFKVGEPVSRTITLTAKGLLASQIKPVELPPVSSFRRYAEPAETETRTDGKSVYAITRRTFTYIPAYEGQQQIPALEIKWWNVLEDKQAIAKLPGWQLNISANPNQPAIVTTPAQKPANSKQPPMVNKPNPDKKIAELPTPADKPAIHPHNKSNQDWSTQLTTLLSDYWYWLLAGFVIFLLARFGKNKPSQHGESAEQEASISSHPPNGINKDSPLKQSVSANTSAIKPLLSDLQKACDQHQAKQAADILLQLSRLHWPDSPPMSLGALSERVPQAKNDLQELDRYLYADNPEPWNGSAICSLFADGIPADETTKEKSGLLKPLYPKH